MRISRNLMKNEEIATFELRNLYQKYGYRQFKMGKFEEYDLYVRNKEFLEADSIITFNDNGRLMALKPDLTLSIIKNYHHTCGYVEKIYYSENIYRASKSAHTYKEILQTGLECMGDIDLYHICEVTALAAKSLAAISPGYVLEISHMGLLEAVMQPLEEALKKQILNCIGQKNLHEIQRLCGEHQIDEQIYRSIELLVTTYGSWRKVLSVLKKAGFTGKAKATVEELETVCSILAANRLAKNINIDFSIVNDMSYYSGILYKGFVKGIPNSILSGGRYDGLMERMGKKTGAIGFAVYLDSLDRLDVRENEFDFDVVFLYEDNDDLRLVMQEARTMREAGESVLVERILPPGVSCRKLIRLVDGEVTILERND